MLWELRGVVGMGGLVVSFFLRLVADGVAE